MFRGLLALAFGFMVPLWSVSAQDSWVLLASHDIELSTGKASIDLDSTQPVKQIRLVAKSGAITLSKVVVSYRDGRTHTEERRINLLVGERTKPIDPRDEEAFADRVTLVIKREAKSAAVARLEVWGLVSEKTFSAVAQEDEVDSLSAQIAQLFRDGKYVDAHPVAEHLIEVTKFKFGDAHPQYATALSWLTKFDLKLGKIADAEPIARRGLAIREMKLGAEHLDTASSLIDLAEVLSYQNRQAEAAPLEQRAVELREKILGPKHPDTAQALRSLGGSFQVLGRFEDAEALFKRALAICEEVLGPDHSDVATSLSDLANLYYSQRHYADAEPLWTRSLAIREKVLGPDHADVGENLNSLANLYYVQDRYADAEPLYKRALTIKERALGPDHADVATNLSDLADLYYFQQRYADAEPLSRRALEIRENLLGPDHAEVAINLNDLGELYRKRSRYTDAEPLFKRALAIYEKMLDPDQANFAVSLVNLADLYKSQARYAEAEPLYVRALAIYEKTLGPEHNDVGTGLERLADLYKSEGRYAEAEPLYKRSLSVREKALGIDHPDVGYSCDVLGRLYMAQGRYAEAEMLFKRYLAVSEKAGGPEHLDVGQSLKHLAELYTNEGRYAEAEPLLKRALAIREKALGPNDTAVGRTLGSLGEIYVSQSRYAEAEPLLNRSLSISETAYPAEHPEVGFSLRNLADLYLDQGRYAEAEPLYERSLAIIENTRGPDYPGVATVLHNLGYLYFAKSDWTRAADYWRRATDVIIRRSKHSGDAIGQALIGKTTREFERSNFQFRGLVKAVHRLAPENALLASQLVREMFVTAQWSESSEAAAALAQMGARHAKGDSRLADLVRKRQELVSAWQACDLALIARKSQPAADRNLESEQQFSNLLNILEAEVGKIDATFAKDFPNYATLVNPEPLSVEEVQADLAADEALVLFLDTPEWKPTAEETFIWVVTKTNSRWAHSDLGTKALQERVAALRCGLDESAWSGDERGKCANLLGLDSKSEWKRGRPLPFDLARAHELYKGLFGDVEDLIKDKHLLLVPSGALTALPLQVLVTSLSDNPTWGARSRDVALLGAELGPSIDETSRQIKVGGVAIVHTLPQGPADAAGLMANDVLLSVAGIEVESAQHAVYTVRAQAPGAAVQVKVLRDGKPVDRTVTLGTTTIREWIPRLYDTSAGDVAWLARRSAITVLPSVASLKALRHNAKTSLATEPFIGFGNPVLTRSCGSVFIPDRCPEEEIQVAAVEGGVARSAGNLETAGAFMRGGLADVAAVKSRLCPLPDTAFELKCVAKNLGANAENLVLGKGMTETAVKHMALDHYRVVHFATHGLLAGETAELAKNHAEPALVFSPPDSATVEDDGLLTASEIAGLKLDADWVIMSACNTAGGGEPGAEALSGLARAFFYAGARALLVSHWPVNSYAATMLTSRTFAELKRDPDLSRSEAFRRAMLALMNDKNRPWAAHPSVWAPFVVVGEGGAQAPH